MSNQSSTSSNVSVLAEAPLTALDVMRHILFAWCTWLTPPLVVVGVTVNLLTIIVFTRSPLGTTPTTRLYYRWIAFFELATISSKDVGFCFLSSALDYISNGNPIYQILWNVWNCRVLFFSYCVFEMNATNAVVALAIERILVLFFPFKASSLISRTKALLGLLLMAVCCVVMTLGVLLYAHVVIVPAYSSLWFCFYGGDAAQQVWQVLSYVCIYILPTFFSTVLTVVIIRKVKSVLTESRKLARKETTASKGELESVVIMVLIVVAHNSLYVPLCIAFITETAVQAFAGNGSLAAVFTTLWQMFYPMIVLTHMSNFFIYCRKVPHFTDNVRNVFLCKPAVTSA